MPVHDGVGAAREVAVGLQAQLAGVGQPGRLPLGLGLQHEVVGAALDRAGHVPTERDLLAGEGGLRRVVDVDAGDVHAGRSPEVVDGRLQPVGPARPPVEVEVVREELVLARVLADDGGLPGEELLDQGTAEPVERCGEGPVDRAPDVRELLPGVDAVGPVVQAVGTVHRVEVVVERRAEVLDERALHVARGDVVVLRLVVELEADDGRAVRGVRQERSDHPLAVEAVGRVGDVHDLACAVALLVRARLGEHVRVRRHEPRRHRVRGCPDDDVDAGGLHRVERPVDVGEVEHAGPGLQRAPRRLGDADHGEVRRLQHRDVGVDAVGRHVLVVVGGPVQDLVHVCPAQSSRTTTTPSAGTTAPAS